MRVALRSRCGCGCGGVEVTGGAELVLVHGSEALLREALHGLRLVLCPDVDRERYALIDTRGTTTTANTTANTITRRSASLCSIQMCIQFTGHTMQQIPCKLDMVAGFRKQHPCSSGLCASGGQVSGRGVGEGLRGGGAEDNQRGAPVRTGGGRGRGRRGGALVKVSHSRGVRMTPASQPASQTRTAQHSIHNNTI